MLKKAVKHDKVLIKQDRCNSLTAHPVGEPGILE